MAPGRLGRFIWSFHKQNHSKDLFVLCKLKLDDSFLERDSTLWELPWKPTHKRLQQVLRHFLSANSNIESRQSSIHSIKTFISRRLPVHLARDRPHFLSLWGCPAGASWEKDVWGASPQTSCEGGPRRTWAMPAGWEKNLNGLRSHLLLPLRDMGRLRSDRATRGLQEKTHLWFAFWSWNLPSMAEILELFAQNKRKQWFFHFRGRRN